MCNMVEMPSEFLTLGEFARRLKLSRSTVYELIRRGTFVEGSHFVRLGGSIRFPWGQGTVDLLLKTAGACKRGTRALPGVAGRRVVIPVRRKPSGPDRTKLEPKASDDRVRPNLTNARRV